MYAMEKQLPLRVLSADDWRHWKTWGYVRVPHAVPSDKVERLKHALWESAGMDPGDRTTWHAAGSDEESLAKSCRGVWDISEEPRVHDTFVDIWDREDLCVTRERANVSPPDGDGHGHGRGSGTGGRVRWDIDTSLDPLPFEVRGVVSLVDTDPEIGGTQAYPKVYRDFSAWLARQPAGRDPYGPDTTGLGEPELLPVNAGDLLVLNGLLPHGDRPNTTRDRVRMAQYVTLTPEGGAPRRD